MSPGRYSRQDDDYEFPLLIHRYYYTTKDLEHRLEFFEGLAEIPRSKQLLLPVFTDNRIMIKQSIAMTSVFLLVLRSACTITGYLSYGWYIASTL